LPVAEGPAVLAEGSVSGEAQLEAPKKKRHRRRRRGAKPVAAEGVQVVAATEPVQAEVVKTGQLVQPAAELPAISMEKGEAKPKKPRLPRKKKTVAGAEPEVVASPTGTTQVAAIPVETGELAEKPRKKRAPRKKKEPVEETEG
jgi:ribonuclease E